MRAVHAPSLSSSPRRPVRLVWTVNTGNQETPRLVSRWIPETELIARAA
jgi:hypothetical protein